MNGEGGDNTVVCKLDCLYGPQVIDVILKKPGTKMKIMLTLFQIFFLYFQ